MMDASIGTDEKGDRKPEPDIFILACKRNGVEPHEAVMIDDLGM